MVDIYERAGKAAEATADIAVKGAGALIGAIGASVVGGIIERGVMGQITPTSTNMRKLGGYVFNNTPKAIGSYLVHEYNPKKGEVLGDFVDGVSYGAAADIGFDTLGRYRNKWAPGVTTLASAAGVEKQPDYNALTEKMHQLLMENTALKQQMGTGAMGSGAMGGTGGFRGMITPPNRPLEKGYQFTEPYGGLQGYPGSGGLERQYEFTEPPVPGVVKEKRPSEKQFQFTTPDGKIITGSVTDANVLKGGFGFVV